MRVFKSLLIFTIAYPTLIFTLVEILESLSLDNGVVTNITSLWVVTYLLCRHYGKQGRRYFSRKEKWLLVTGLLLIDLFIQGLGAAIVLSLESSSIPLIPSMVFMALLVETLHLATIAITVNRTEKELQKQGLIDFTDVQKTNMSLVAKDSKNTADHDFNPYEPPARIVEDSPIKERNWHRKSLRYLSSMVLGFFFFPIFTGFVSVMSWPIFHQNQTFLGENFGLIALLGIPLGLWLFRKLTAKQYAYWGSATALMLLTTNLINIYRPW